MSFGVGNLEAESVGNAEGVGNELVVQGNGCRIEGNIKA